jgi:hypothetical protein
MALALADRFVAMSRVEGWVFVGSKRDELRELVIRDDFLEKIGSVRELLALKTVGLPLGADLRQLGS